MFTQAFRSLLAVAELQRYDGGSERIESLYRLAKS
jgi:hypothetical protein